MGSVGDSLWHRVCQDCAKPSAPPPYATRAFRTARAACTRHWSTSMADTDRITHPPRRRRNSEIRSREYLTADEVEKLIDAPQARCAAHRPIEEWEPIESPDPRARDPGVAKASSGIRGRTTSPSLCIRTCCSGMAAATSSRMTATTPGRSSTTWGTRTSRTRFGIRSSRRIVSRTSGATNAFTPAEPVRRRSRWCVGAGSQSKRLSTMLCSELVDRFGC